MKRYRKGCAGFQQNVYSRRDAMRIGSLGALGLSLGNVLRLEAAQKKDSGELRKMQSDLEKDRTLVIDYLDDLDKRLGDLEKSVAAPDTPPAPAAPTPQPAPAPSPSPAKPQ